MTAPPPSSPPLSPMSAPSSYAPSSPLTPLSAPPTPPSPPSPELFDPRHLSEIHIDGRMISTRDPAAFLALLPQFPYITSLFLTGPFTPCAAFTAHLPSLNALKLNITASKSPSEVFQRLAKYCFRLTTLQIHFPAHTSLSLYSLLPLSTMPTLQTLHISAAENSLTLSATPDGSPLPTLPALKHFHLLADGLFPESALITLAGSSPQLESLHVPGVYDLLSISSLSQRLFPHLEHVVIKQLLPLWPEPERAAEVKAAAEVLDQCMPKAHISPGQHQWSGFTRDVVHEAWGKRMERNWAVPGLKVVPGIITSVADSGHSSGRSEGDRSSASPPSWVYGTESAVTTPEDQVRSNVSSGLTKSRDEIRSRATPPEWVMMEQERTSPGSEERGLAKSLPWVTSSEIAGPRTRRLGDIPEDGPYRLIEDSSESPKERGPNDVLWVLGPEVARLRTHF
ncbi:hypothetical protein K461DRAFT_265858 [Myriangium duriaei CBS 260.36]|uniref:Uncharacterized protein n=1 Tax=Myriangium duriaei CBS 260.36 TaxID=1168546 RepID=A0A9P4MRE4_9PEZI|nr:hypothetical protein K461DRAFT_265858 [Myriangium duriaei CBS 260.36]